jgi:hypothetical protein
MRIGGEHFIKKVIRLVTGKEKFADAWRCDWVIPLSVCDCDCMADFRFMEQYIAYQLHRQTDNHRTSHYPNRTPK